jgi:hypothetical protein
MEQISINKEVLGTLLRKMASSYEEIQLLIEGLDRSISNAELEGWNDQRYHSFKDTFLDTKAMFQNGLRKLEEENIQYIKRLLKSIEDLN